jgi:type I site-specific restriction-modification system R (restriction) subunit
MKLSIAVHGVLYRQDRAGHGQPHGGVITDRNDLDDQLFDTFAASKQLLRQEPVQAQDRGHLKELLKVASGGVVFTTIQKFQPEQGNVYDTLSGRENRWNKGRKY